MEGNGIVLVCEVLGQNIAVSIVALHFNQDDQSTDEPPYKKQTMIYFSEPELQTDRTNPNTPTSIFSYLLIHDDNYLSKKL